MGRADEKLAVQVGSKGYFGKVSLEAEAEDRGGNVTVDFDPSISGEWRTGASFGIDYALDHVTRRSLFPKGGRVRVLSIGGHAVDTTNVVIAFVAANAIYKALGVQPIKRPEFDKNTGVFSFPK
ncbi:MAG: hypothetical protein EXS16_16265 [Gemmataceae bacterium]|nr:hypothetical protein [Gemmataceae bacterium]